MSAELQDRPVLQNVIALIDPDAIKQVPEMLRLDKMTLQHAIRMYRESGSLMHTIAVVEYARRNNEVSAAEETRCLIFTCLNAATIMESDEMFMKKVWSEDGRGIQECLVQAAVYRQIAADLLKEAIQTP